MSGVSIRFGFLLDRRLGAPQINFSWACRAIWENPAPRAGRRRKNRRWGADSLLHTHQSAALRSGRERGAKAGGWPLKRGRNMTVQVLAGAKGRLLAILLTGGETHDYP
jgi:hypothetical protein